MEQESKIKVKITPEELACRIKERKSIKITPEELAYRIDNEGIGYAIMNYYGKVKSTDEHAETLWNDAYDSLKKLTNILNTSANMKIITVALGD